MSQGIPSEREPSLPDDVPGAAASEAPDLPPILPGPVEPVQPLDVDGIRPMIVLTIGWGIAAVVLAFRWSDLADDGRLWWLWTCVAGFGMGLLGYVYCRRRRDARLVPGS